MVHIACAQMVSGPSADENFADIEAFCRQASSIGAKLLVLPEECLTLGMTDAQKVALSQESSLWQERLQGLAKRYGIWLVAGSVPVSVDSMHYYSTTWVFDDQELVESYQKIHLFDVSVDEKLSYQESKHVKAGHKPKVFSSPFGIIGLSICYDVRFPELYRLLSAQGAEILLVPSAFTPQTGKVHWETLLRARAIENICYVIAPNQYGTRASGEGTYGHSMIINPWGEILATQNQGPGLISVDIDLKFLRQCRARFPVLDHRIF